MFLVCVPYQSIIYFQREEKAEGKYVFGFGFFFSDFFEGLLTVEERGGRINWYSSRYAIN